MFIKFFDNLRKSGIPVSLREYLTFLEALTKNIGTYEIENFYILARTIMVKDERNLDRFDIAFSHTFNGLDELSLEEIINKAELPDDWLKKLAEKHLSQEEMAEIDSLGGFEKLMEEIEIEIIKNTEVREIITKNNKITGVVVNNEEIIEADNVICNADPPAFYEKMTSKNLKNSMLFDWKQKRMDYSMGLFVYYFGTKKVYENVEHHTIKFGNKYKEHLDDIFDHKKLNNDISYYLHRPSATDKSMAPEGSDCFYVLVPVPNNQSNIDWQIEGEKMKNLVIDKMENDLMPNLRSNIVSDFYLTPDYFEKELNTKYGSGFSIQPKFTQSAYFRFHNKSEIYNGLYFVGAGTHPGAGIPSVVTSAEVMAKLIPDASYIRLNS